MIYLIGVLVLFGILCILYFSLDFIVRLLLIRGIEENVKKEEGAIRVALLGVSSICLDSVVFPSRKNKEVIVYGVASRSKEKASRFARCYKIDHVYSSYDELLSDENVDAVYIGLPTSLHQPWCEKALLAGKHVLCEKPLCNNEDEAFMLQNLQVKSKKILFEGMHWKYHPAAVHMKAMIERGEIGKIVSVTASYEIPARQLFYKKDDGRLSKSLGGGCFMDLGVYCVSAVRYFSGEEPLVREAVAERLGDTDLSMEAKYDLPKCKGRGMIHCALNRWKLNVSVRVEGEEGSLFLFNFVYPHYLHFITFKKSGDVTKTLRHYHAGNTSYEYQLSSFVGQVKEGYSKSTVEDALKTMKVVDETYSRAGMKN